MIMIMSMSSIDIEVIRTVLLFFIKIFCTKKTHKYQISNILIELQKHNKQHKQLSLRCKAINFLLKYRLKKYS